MDFGHDERTRELAARLESFMDSHIYPAEPVHHEQAAQAAEEGDPWRRPAVVAELKVAARERGLWNLFLPGHSGGAGLTNLQYAPLAEITGRSPALAPEALNCAAPDTGNMEVLAEFGSPEQQARWLKPLLDGAIRSAFCMTEPDVASSDASNIATRIQRACCSGEPNSASTSMLPVSGAAQFSASGASAALCPVISASGAYCRFVRPAPPECPGRNRFHSPRSRAATLSSATTAGRRHGSPSCAALTACSW